MSESVKSSTPPATVSDATPAAGLDAFCDDLELNLPTLRLVDGRNIPEPYRSLLVHDRDMTPTLEAHCGYPLRLRVIDRREENSTLYRQVILAGIANSRPAVYGAIRIYLNRFSSTAQAVIRECVVPLGTILSQQNIPHHSRPSAYFAVEPDEAICRLLGMKRPSTIFDRHNALYQTGNGVLAQVLEILPPVHSDESELDK